MNNLYSPDKELSLTSLLEALLFVAPSTISVAQLAVVLDMPASDIEKGLLELEAHLNEPDSQHGLRLQRHRGRVQLTSDPRAAWAVERLLGLEASGRLSRAALETIAIIMYREPVTRPQIDAIRGVNSDGVLRSLLVKGLIQEIGRASGPGRPILYSVTPEFLQYFGLNSLDELPPLDLEELPQPDQLIEL